MSNLAARLVIYAKVPEKGWRRLPVAMTANGRLKPGVGRVDNAEHSFTEYRYQVGFYEGAQLRYENAGTDAADALAALKKRKAQASIRSQAAEQGIVLMDSREQRIPLAEKVEEFLNVQLQKNQPESEKVYRLSLESFMSAMPAVKYVDQIDAKAALAFHGQLRQRGLSERTIANRHIILRSFLLWLGNREQAKAIGRPPKYDRLAPVSYTVEELAALKAAAKDQYSQVVLELAFKTGLRDAELCHLEWTDLDFKRKQLHVRGKAHLGFRLKDREERIVPLPDSLIAVLKHWKEQRPKSSLVLGVKDKPPRHLLRIIKMTARKAGLNCRTCESCRKTNNRECGRWQLHGLRRSYATHLERNGFSVRQIQGLLGHSEIATTLRYLSSVSSTEAQRLMSAVQW